jgi:hypothetical protein
MFVTITYLDWGSFDDIGVWKAGLEVRTDRMFLYEVIDKPLFFLSVIKYGIEFTEMK